MTTRDVVAIFGGLALATLVPVIWAIVDFSRRPPWQFSRGRKVMWALTLSIGWIILWPVALISSVVYLTVIRRRFPPVPTTGTQPPYHHYGQGYGQGFTPGYGQGYPPAPPPPPPPTSLPPAGWYPDPAGSPQERWWDGRGWTEHLR